MNIPPKDKWLNNQVLGFLFFILVVLLFIFEQQVIAIRVIGIVLAVAGISIIKTQRVSYGWEGHEPSGLLTGVPALIFGFLMLGLSIFIFIKPNLMLIIFGWGSA
jgi:hypothetical protein